jgi:uncharacterized protein (TIGR02266 family)
LSPGDGRPAGARGGRVDAQAGAGHTARLTVTTQPPVRVRLRYASLETFLEGFAPNVTRGGVFLASRTPRPVGEVFTFEVQLAGGEVALAGEGKVIWIKEYNPAEPGKAHGMGVQFMRLEPGAREVLNRLLQIKSGARPAGEPRGGTQPGAALAAARTGNGTTLRRPTVDTSVDLAGEYGLDEAALRRAVDRVRVGGVRPTEDSLDELLTREPLEPATLAQALSELPRLLDPAARRRSGVFRTLDAGTRATAPAPVAPATQTDVDTRD